MESTISEIPMSGLPWEQVSQTSWEGVQDSGGNWNIFSRTDRLVSIFRPIDFSFAFMSHLENNLQLFSLEAI